MLKVTLLLGLLLILNSCQLDYTMDFKIKNETSMLVDSLYLLPNKDGKKYIQLKPQEVVNYTVDISETPMGDGAFVISYTLDGQKKQRGFGYFDNHNTFADHYDLTIKKDTLIIKEIR